MQRNIESLLTQEVMDAINAERNSKSQKGKYEFEEISFFDVFRNVENIISDYSENRHVSLREAIQNSLDAGATKINLKAYNLSNGKQNVIFSDNGKGMTFEVLSRNYFGWAKEKRPEDANDIGGFGLGSIAVMSGKNNIVITRTEEGTYVGIYNPDFFLKKDFNAYPIIVGPFNCSIAETLRKEGVRKNLLPNGNGTVIIMEETDMCKKDRNAYYTNKELKALLLKKTHAGDLRYLSADVDMETEFPLYNIEVENNDNKEHFYGYFRFVNYHFIHEYNAKFGTDINLDNISSKKEAMDLLEELRRNNAPILFKTRKLFPNEENNDSEIIVFFGDGKNILVGPLRDKDEKIGGAYLNGDNAQNYRGIFLVQKGLEIKKYGSRDDVTFSTNSRELSSHRICDRMYCAFINNTGRLTSNRNGFISSTEEFNIFEDTAIKTLEEIIQENKVFLEDLITKKSEFDIEEHVAALAKNRTKNISLKNITCSTTNEIVKNILCEIKDTKCEKTTMEVHATLNTIFKMMGKNDILPTIISFLNDKGASFDATAKVLSTDAFIDTEDAILEYEYKLTDFNHPINTVDYISCFTLGDINESNFDFNGSTAEIIRKKNGTYLSTKNRSGFPIRLFIMEDYLNNLDEYLA